jgi:hypothetical protein
MAAKSYPVKLYYFVANGKKRLFQNSNNAWSAAYTYGQSIKADVQIYIINIKRTLDKDIAFALIDHDFSKFNVILGDKVQYFKPQETPKPPKAKDCYEVLGITNSDYLTKEVLKSLFRKAAMKAHPDQGGTTASMQEVNKAHVDVKRNHGW